MILKDNFDSQAFRYALRVDRDTIWLTPVHDNRIEGIPKNAVKENQQ